MAAHAYWRIKPTANNGGEFLVIAEIEMRAAIGGADQCTGGTVIKSPSGWRTTTSTPTDAFDNNNATWAESSRLTLPPAVVDVWLGYQFAAAVDIVEFTIRSHSSLTTTYAPKDFTLDYSDDGASWTTAYSVNGIADWTTAQTKTFVVGDPAVNKIEGIAATVAREVNNSGLKLEAVTAQVLREVLPTGVNLHSVSVQVLRENVSGEVTARPQICFTT